MITNSLFDRSLKPFAHFCVHDLREGIILIKIIYFAIYTDFALFYGSPMHFAYLILLHKMANDKITIFNDLSKLVF